MVDTCVSFDIHCLFSRGPAIRAYVSQIDLLYNSRLIAGRGGVSNVVV